MLSEQRKCTDSAITVFDSVFEIWQKISIRCNCETSRLVWDCIVPISIIFSHCLLIFSHFLFAVSLFRFSYQILDGASEIIPILLTQAKFWNCVKLSYQFLWRHYIFITLKNFRDVEHIQYKAPNKDFMLVLSQENM